MKVTRLLLGFVALLAGGLACSLRQPQGELPGLVATITAQVLTIQAAGNAARPAAETPSGPSDIPTATRATGVEASVTSRTNCRRGPSAAFDLVLTADAGQTFKVVGKNTSTGYWIIDEPTGGTCWLEGQYAVLTGDPSTLPEFPAPDRPAANVAKTPKPTQPSKTPKPSALPTFTDIPTIGVAYTPGVPMFPTYVLSHLNCYSTMVASDKYWIEDIVVTWQDNADNETGYRLYIQPKGMAVGLGTTLPPNSTELKWQEQNPDWVNEKYPYVTYYVVAFNDVGESIRMGTLLQRCH